MGFTKTISCAGLCLAMTCCESWRFSTPVSDLSIRTPGTWRAASQGTEGRISTGWLSDFNDPDLTRTVHEALAHNRDLKVSAARMKELKQLAIVAKARKKPGLNLSNRSSTTSDADQSHSLNLSASWEPDLWGRLANLSNAAESDAYAAVEDFRAARLSLVANTAKAWCNLISAEQELSLANLTLESYSKNLRIVERTYKSTGDGALDIQFSRTNVSSAKRSVETSTYARDEAARALELLLGRYPAGTERNPRELPTMRQSVPAGLPANLLDRRADLSAARADLFASAERAEAARKALLPSFSLTATGGSSSSKLTQLLDPHELALTIAENLTQIITDGGETAAQARAALARNEAQIHSYTQTALEAFQEVESALAADRSLAIQEKHLASELKQAALAERQAERDYSEGVNSNILSILEAQRRANNARASMIRLRNNRLQNRIDLHLALGGDFQTTPFNQ